MADNTTAKQLVPDITGNAECVGDSVTPSNNSLASILLQIAPLSPSGDQSRYAVGIRLDGMQINEKLTGTGKVYATIKRSFVFFGDWNGKQDGTLIPL